MVFVVIFLVILITSFLTSLDPLKKLSRSDQLFVSIYWLKNKHPAVVFYDYLYLLPLLSYICSRLSRLHGSLNDLFIFQDIKLSQKHIDLLENIRRIFEEKTIFKEDQTKSDVDTFLDTLIEIYSYVVSAKKVKLQEILSPEQIEKLYSEQAYTYINLSQTIEELLKNKDQEPNVVKSKTVDFLKRQKFQIMILLGILFLVYYLYVSLGNWKEILTQLALGGVFSLVVLLLKNLKKDNL